jgi:hypothetical protein
MSALCVPRTLAAGGVNPAPLRGAPPREQSAMSEQYLSEMNERLHRLEELRPSISDIKSRLSRLERTIEQVHRLEVSLAKVKDIEAERAASQEAQIRVPPEIGEIIKNLDQPLEIVRRTFRCSHCETRNRVAVHLKCTACDTNSWLGWWPERRTGAQPGHAGHPAQSQPVAHDVNGAAGGGKAAGPGVPGAAGHDRNRVPEPVRALRADL